MPGIGRSTTTLASYTHDALSRRVTEDRSGTVTDLYYSSQWQVLEERVSGTTKIQYVWSPVYVDALVLRDRDANGQSGDGLEERLYVQQDANWNVTALVDASGNLVERYVYDPYGNVTVLTPSWGSRASTLYAWVYLHQGGRYENVSALYHFRYREYLPALGRWGQRDPIEYQAGDGNLYRYLGNSSLSTTDPLGLWVIKRQGFPKADATAEKGDTARTLANTIGLSMKEFTKWLSLTTIKLANGKTVTLEQLGADDEICPGETVQIPNNIAAIWMGDLAGFGQAIVKWDDDIRWLKDRGFSVGTIDIRPGAKTAGKDVIGILAAGTKAKTLHGIEVWGHGNPVGFGTRTGRGLFISYDELERALSYHLALVILNVCNGGWSRTDKNIPGVPGGTILAGGKDLVSDSPAAKHFFLKELLIPGKNNEHPWNILKPGEQGTRK